MGKIFTIIKVIFGYMFKKPFMTNPNLAKAEIKKQIEKGKQYLQSLSNDVLKEEQDVISENSLDNDLKAIMKSVSSKGRKWFMDKIDE